jgi:DNA recombination protein RmuC
MVVSLSLLLLSVLIALVIGGWLGWLSQRGRISVREQSETGLIAERRVLQEQVTAAAALAGAKEATARAERERAERLEEERRELLREKDRAEDRATSAETALEAERKQSVEKLALLNQAREELSNQFKALAGEILEVNSRRFTEQNRENIGQLLTPLREKINEFQSKVEEVQKEGIAGRSELKEQIGHL